MKNKQAIIRGISLILLICVNASFAQLIKPKDSYVVYINYPDYTIKTSVSNTTKKHKVDEELTYYWYASNKIMATKGDFDGKLIDGPYVSFYLSSNLKEKGNFKNGLKMGKWISWYENGKIDEITYWSNGKKSGSYKKFNEDESLSISANYKNDKLKGTKTEYVDGQITSQKKYKRGKEIIKKEKSSTKKSIHLKEKISTIFRKKQKQPKEKSENIEPSDEKGTGKKRLNKFLKKKETSSVKEVPITQQEMKPEGTSSK